MGVASLEIELEDRERDEEGQEEEEECWILRFANEEEMDTALAIEGELTDDKIALLVLELEFAKLDLQAILV